MVLALPIYVKLALLVDTKIGNTGSVKNSV
jgi:hypothetical protein